MMGDQQTCSLHCLEGTVGVAVKQLDLGVSNVRKPDLLVFSGKEQQLCFSVAQIRVVINIYRDLTK